MIYEEDFEQNPLNYVEDIFEQKTSLIANADFGPLIRQNNNEMIQQFIKYKTYNSKEESDLQLSSPNTFPAQDITSFLKDSQNSYLEKS